MKKRKPFWKSEPFLSWEGLKASSHLFVWDSSFGKTLRSISWDKSCLFCHFHTEMRKAFNSLSHKKKFCLLFPPSDLIENTDRICEKYKFCGQLRQNFSSINAVSVFAWRGFLSVFRLPKNPCFKMGVFDLFSTDLFIQIPTMALIQASKGHFLKLQPLSSFS